ELAAMIKSDKVAHKDYLVVDVRDDDFVGGNIKVRAIQGPKPDFSRRAVKLVEQVADVPVVIFHCALSQERGPKSARIYKEVRDHPQSKESVQEVYVLRGGFTEFQQQYSKDPLLVENWDEEVWNSEWH
ncbi:hypothetical protein FB45DRAFT_736751, partial [Roridomyces roridus]